MNSNLKTFVFWVVLIFLAVVVWAVIYTGGGKHQQEMSFTHFLSEVSSGRVKKVEITGNEVRGEFRDDASKELHTVVPTGYDKTFDILSVNKVDVVIKESTNGSWVSLLFNAVPFLLLMSNASLETMAGLLPNSALKAPGMPHAPKVYFALGVGVALVAAGRAQGGDQQGGRDAEPGGGCAVELQR